jgi:DNA helicase-2/ATP-dependent DNA helicase PcrA
MNKKSNDLLSSLNKAQQQAVAYNKPGPLLVLAGAGSGKTRVLTHRTAYLIANQGVSPNNLLLLTFTNKAAREMKARLQRLLAKQNKKSEGLFAGTFHSFGAYILRREANRVGLSQDFVIYDQKDQQSLLKKIIKKMNLDESRFKARSIKYAINDAKNSLIEPETYLDSVSSEWEETVGLIYQNYQKFLAKAQALDFADLLYYPVKLLQENNEVQRKYQQKYQHILIDEYQDTNQSQYALTKLLAKNHQNLTVVGDAAQAIYSWRGADYRNLMSLTKDFPDTQVINLKQNYRSTQNILDAAYCVISKNEKHPVLKLFTEKDKGKQLTVYQAKSGAKEAEYVVDKIQELVNQRKVDPQQVAVLYRTNAQSRLLEEAFINHGLPYILYGGTKFYERKEVKDVLALIRVYFNPEDVVSWERIEKNFGIRRMRKVKKFLKENKEREFITAELFGEILKASRYLDKYDEDDEDDAQRLENIRELSTVARKFKDISEFLENVALVQQEYSVQEKNKQNRLNQAVNLMTLHSSKGLEFDTVFIIGMEEGLLPHSRSLDDVDELEEERRLCYVGMTRAKKRLYLTYADHRLYFGRTNYNNPSRFLEDLPSHLVERKGGKKEEITIDDDWDEFDDDWLNDW